MLLVFAVVPAAITTLENLGVKSVQAIIQESRFAHYFTDTNIVANFISTVMK